MAWQSPSVWVTLQVFWFLFIMVCVQKMKFKRPSQLTGAAFPKGERGRTCGGSQAAGVLGVGPLGLAHASWPRAGRPPQGIASRLLLEALMSGGRWCCLERKTSHVL